MSRIQTILEEMLACAANSRLAVQDEPMRSIAGADHLLSTLIHHLAEGHPEQETVTQILVAYHDVMGEDESARTVQGSEHLSIRQKPGPQNARRMGSREEREEKILRKRSLDESRRSSF